MKRAAGQRTTFLLGAGASYGHVDPQKWATPPMMANFLSRAVMLGVLTEKEFPELARECINRGGESNLLESCLRLEKQYNLESFLRSIQDPWVLQLARFFLWRFLGDFSKEPLHDDSAYRSFSSYVKARLNNVKGIISLNYDTLCELALAGEAIQGNYALAPNSGGDVLYLKPHGSVNFRFPIATYIATSVRDWRDFLEGHNAIIETNRFSGRWVESYSPAFSFEQDFLADKLLTEARKLEFIPALVPPLGDQKYYEQFDSYGLIWNKIGELLKQTEELVVIGTAMNKEESKLWNCLRRHLSKNSLVTIVSKDESTAQAVGRKFKKRGFKQVVPLRVGGFYQYATKYLRAGSAE